MGMMSRMRSLAPWFMFLVGGIFVIFMVLSDSKLTDFLHDRSQNVGSVDGENISYQDYSNFVERARKNQEQNGQTIDESQMDYFRDQVWDAMVTQKLIEKKIQQYGIVVTDDEIRNVLLGTNPPAELTKQFTDSTGHFNRQLYESTIRDPRNQQIMVAVEDQVRQQLIQQKLQDYITASITVSDAEAQDAFIKQNIKMKADYVSINYNSIPDADIKVTDDEVKNYYDNHPEEFQVDAQRKLKYVLFRRQPSEADSVMIKKNLEAIVAKIKNDTASFKSYVNIYSEVPYKRDTISLVRLPDQARTVLGDAKIGDVVGPVLTFQGYVVYKLVDKVTSKNTMVRASHILIKSTGDDKADLKKATDIYDQIMKGANFETEAKLYSDDGSKINGGDLGWFGKGQMVKPFEEACFNGKVGVVQKPIKTQFGYHIIKVTGKSNTDYVVEQIVNRIQISATTADKVYQDAQDFSYIANKDGFDSEAKLMKYTVGETTAFEKDAAVIPGLGTNSALVKWAFDESTSSISDVFKVPAGYVVVMISDASKAGLKKFDDVKAQIKYTVTHNKKAEKAMSILSDIRSKVGDSGDASAIAKTVWNTAKVDTTSEFTMSGTVPGIGREFAFTDYAYKADMNKWSQPVKGALGAYLIKVTYRTQFNNTTFNLQKSELKKELLNSKKSRYFMQWVQDLKKEANIVDNRYLFYRY